jgi:hypothetical protein
MDDPTDESTHANRTAGPSGGGAVALLNSSLAPLNV